MAGGNTTTIGVAPASIVDGIKGTIAQMVSNAAYAVRPTAIYSNPVLLELIDREMKTEYNVVLNTVEITAGLRVKALTTQAGELPLIPDWTIPYTLRERHRCIRLHRERGSDRVSLVERSEPAGVQAGPSQCPEPANGGGEVRRTCGEGGELRALPGECATVTRKCSFIVSRSRWVWVHCLCTDDRRPATNDVFRRTRELRAPYELSRYH